MPEVASGASVSVSAGGDNGDAAVGNPYQRGPDPTLAGVPPGNGFNGGTTYHPDRHRPGALQDRQAGVVAALLAVGPRFQGHAFACLAGH